jgi:hypothetical protein
MIREEVRVSNNGVLRQRVKVYEPDTYIGVKAVRQDSKDNLVVTVNNVRFDADATSMAYMANVIAIANMKYNQAISSGVDVDTAYASVYKQTVSWKNADNKISNIQVETIAEALELAMGEIANIIGV